MSEPGQLPPTAELRTRVESAMARTRQRSTAAGLHAMHLERLRRMRGSLKPFETMTALAYDLAAQPVKLAVLVGALDDGVSHLSRTLRNQRLGKGFIAGAVGLAWRTMPPGALGTLSVFATVLGAGWLAYRSDQAHLTALQLEFDACHRALSLLSDLLKESSPAIDVWLLKQTLELVNARRRLVALHGEWRQS